ncbi:MAG: M48 family metalloprotease, partial [Sedimentisphaerales bacterium]|nr:M48 family metalloprotease [Sedimentisphaerales bacterium]
MNALLEQINSVGKTFVDFAIPMLIQSSVLIIILLALDTFLRNRIRAVFRYWIWMIVLVKLMLFPTLSLPTSPSYWFGQKMNRPLYFSETSSTADNNYNTISPYEYRYPQTHISTGRATSLFYFENNDSAFHAEPKTQEISLSWQGSVFLGWLTFVGIMVILLIQKTFVVRRLIMQSQQANDSLVNILEQACGKIGIRQKISLRLSPTALSPSVCGLFKPTILIPKKLIEKISSNDLHAILLHEMAHIKRHDLWVNLLQAILQIIYIYNPLLWIANIVIRNVREQAVDEMVLVAMGQQAEEYPKTLLNISRYNFGSAVLSLRLIGVAESKKALIARIKHITSRPFPTNTKLGLTDTLMIIIAAFIFLPMARAEKSIETDKGTDFPLFTNNTNNTLSPYELIRNAQTEKAESNIPPQPAETIQQDKPVEPAKPSETTTSEESAKIQQLETLPKERIIHFPKDHSLGTYCIRMPSDDPGAGVPRSFMQNLEYIGEAQGDISVPSNAQVTLSIDPTTANLSGLDKLQPDDLYCVMAGPNPLDPIGINTGVGNSIMPHIARLTGLKALQLCFTEVTDVGMKYITALKSLEQLETSTQITDRGMAYVGQLTSLKFLWVYGPSQVTDAGLQHVSKLTSLEGLILIGDLMGDEGLIHIRNLPHLQYLHLRSPNFGDHGMVHLTGLKSLKTLNFSKAQCFISNEGLAQIAKIPNLEELILDSRGDPTDEGLAHLTNMRSLKILKFPGLHLTDKGCAYLKQIKTLEILDSSTTSQNITDEGMIQLGELSNLKQLCIVNNNKDSKSYGDKGLESLAKCRKLEDLVINSVSITDAGMEHIAKLSNLKKLEIWDCLNITDKGLAKLTNLKKLEWLNIRTPNLSVSGINNLKEMPNLTYLRAQFIKKGDAVLNIPTLTNLTTLMLGLKDSSEKFHDEDLRCLSNLKQLTDLQLGEREYSDDGLAYLSGLTKLERISIGGSRITDEGLKHLADMKNLRSLIVRREYDSNKRGYISGGNITDEGLRYLERFENLSHMDIAIDGDFSDEALWHLHQKFPDLILLLNGGMLML